MAGGGVGMAVDLDSLREQLKATDKKFAASVRKQLRAATAEAGAELLAAVKSEASWSSRIPGATSVTFSFSANKAGARLKVDKRKAPHARPLEQGNSTTFSDAVINKAGGFKTVNGKRVAVNRFIYKAMKKTGNGVGRALRHPVYHKIGEPGGFATQPTRPFFFAAVDARTPGIEKKFETAVKKIADEAGFKGV